MVTAAKCGVSYSDYLQMDDIELAYYARGTEIKKTEEIRWQRFFTAALLSPHSKKPIKPVDLIQLPDESSSGTIQKADAEQKKKTLEVFKKWDNKE